MKNTFARLIFILGISITLLSGCNDSTLDESVTAFTDSYRVDYVQTSSMEAMAGKSTFQIRITSLETNKVVTGLSPMFMPMMHMDAGYEHSSPKPVTSVVEDADGLYTVTVYYLMPSSMNGTSMGKWDLKFTINGEEAHLYPDVKMAMGDTMQVRLKGGTGDQVMAMVGGMEGRTYFMFKEGLSGSVGNYAFSMFIATKESMMSFPAVYTGGTISSTPIASAAVQVSVDAGANWISASEGSTNGVWTASGLSLTAGEENQIRVKLTVNSEVKTTDGATVDPGVNDYQTFTITPGSM